jgi:hypothetical protein
MAIREAALVDWEQWQLAHPGPHAWRNDDTCVVASDGTEQLGEEGTRAPMVYYRAMPDRPAELIVQGPVRLRIEARPLLDADSHEVLHDWLRVVAAERQWRFPVDGQPPIGNLKLVSDSAIRPGRAAWGVITLGPGRHALALAGQHHALVVRVAVWRPRLALSALPRLSPGIADAARCGCWGQLQPLSSDSGQRVRQALYVQIIRSGDTAASSDATRHSVSVPLFVPVSCCRPQAQPADAAWAKMPSESDPQRQLADERSALDDPAHDATRGTSTARRAVGISSRIR